jgi:hypothetical protein
MQGSKRRICQILQGLSFEGFIQNERFLNISKLLDQQLTVYLTGIFIKEKSVILGYNSRG